MAIDTKHEDLQSLRIDRSRDDADGEPPPWARRYILGGIAMVVLLGLSALGLPLVRASTRRGGSRACRGGRQRRCGGMVLSASGYIVAHHKINVNSKVTGRVKWIGVEKGDKVKEGQVLVRLEDDEFRAQYEQAQGASKMRAPIYEELQHGSRPEEMQQAQHNLMRRARRWPTTRSLWTAPGTLRRA